MLIINFTCFILSYTSYKDLSGHAWESSIVQFQGPWALRGGQSVVMGEVRRLPWPLRLALQQAADIHTSPPRRGDRELGSGHPGGLSGYKCFAEDTDPALNSQGPEEGRCVLQAHRLGLRPVLCTGAGPHRLGLSPGSTAYFEHLR